MYYTTYRPKTLQELDNTKVKDLLSTVLKANKIPHAFLFIGQKGTGKTSSARIIAKAVNCLENAFSSKGTSIEPCNRCRECVSIEKSSSADVTELDAASNRGIDDMKRLIMESNFLPLASRYRVYIIDEAHMITSDAFNALLKTLEEPPDKVIFILATTNVEKVPKTIISRCTVVNFGIAHTADIVRMLKRISAKERVTVSTPTIELIAKNSEHSFRDASKLLEELVIQKKLDYEEAKKYLGVVKQDFLDILFTKDMTAALEWIQFFEKQGGNIRSLLTDLLYELHDMLMSPSPQRDRREIVRLMKLLSDAYSLVRFAPVETVPLEIAVVEFYNHEKKK